MATFYGTTGHDLWTWKIEVWETDVSVANNTSVVHVASYMSRKTLASYFGGNAYITTRADGQWQERVYKTYSYPTNVAVDQWIYMHEASFTITHDADGSKTITVGSQMDDANFSPKWANVQGTFTLTTIARASTPSVSGTGTIGGSMTIYTNRAANSFTHTLKYAFGNTSGTIATNVGASTSWNIPLDLAKQIPNATSGYGTITCTTYSGGKSIGSKSCQFTLKTSSSSMKPSVSIVVEEANYTVKAKKFDFFVEGLSQLKGVITATPKYGASIKAYSTSIFGSSYSSQEFTTNLLPYAGNPTVDVTVKDSRGYTADTSTKINIEPYFKPSVYGLSVERCLADGTIDREGTYVRISCTAKVAYLLGKNVPSLSVYYNEQGDEANKVAVTFNNPPTREDYSGSGMFLEYSSELVTTKTFDIDKVYTFTFTSSDLFNTSTASENLTTAFDIINISESGKRIAFGKLAPQKDFWSDEYEERFDISMPGYYNERPMLSYKGSSNLLVHPYKSTSPLLSIAEKNAPAPVDYCCYLEANKWYTMSYKSDNEPRIGRYSSMWLIHENWGYSYHTSFSASETFKPAESGLYYLCGHHSGAEQIRMYDFKVERGKEATAYDKPKNSKIYASLADDDEQLLADLGNSVLNWRTIWKGELLGGQNLWIDFTPYKRLKIHFNSGACTGSFELDTETNPSIIYNDQCYFMGSGVSGYAQSGVFEYHTCQVGMRSDMQVFYNHRMGYTRGSSWTEKNIQGDYFIYKIEGILKE